MKRLGARVVGEDDVEWCGEGGDVESKRDDEIVWCNRNFCSTVKLCRIDSKVRKSVVSPSLIYSEKC